MHDYNKKDRTSTQIKNKREHLSKKYDKIAKKTDRRLDNNNLRVRLYGKGSVTLADAISLASMSYTRKTFNRLIAHIGASKIRQLRSNGASDGELRKIGLASLGAMGLVTGYTLHTQKRLVQDIIDTRNYDTRQYYKKQNANKK